MFRVQIIAYTWKYIKYESMLTSSGLMKNYKTISGSFSDEIFWVYHEQAYKRQYF